MGANVLVLSEMCKEELARLSRTYDVISRLSAGPCAIGDEESEADVVWTTGPIGFTSADMDRCPRLRLIVVQHVGFEGVDVGAAHARGTAVVNGRGCNAECVADHAFALALSLLRAVPSNDAALRSGAWGELRRPTPTVSGLRPASSASAKSGARWRVAASASAWTSATTAVAGPRG